MLQAGKLKGFSGNVREFVAIESENLERFGQVSETSLIQQGYPIVVEIPGGRD